MAQKLTSGGHTRVAVVAVHGVGKHDAGASARAMADLLLGLGRQANSSTCASYVAFEEEAVQMPLPSADRFHHGDCDGGGIWTRLRTTFEERRGFFRDLYRAKNWRKEKQAPIDKKDLASEFMATQLSGYQGDQNQKTYSTVRLVGRRPNNQADRPDLHIYEMHWSDLSRPSSSFVRFLMSFYQLLLHLSSLGRTAIDQAALEHVGKLEWFLLQRSYNYAVRVLTLVIFNLFLLLPVVAFSPLVLMLTGATAQVVAGAVFAAAFLGIAVVVTQLGFWLSSRVWWLYLALSSAAAGAIFYFILQRHTDVSVVLIVEWWTVGYAIVLYVLKKYDEVRNGALQSGLILMALAAIGFVACALTSQTSEFLREAAFRLIFYTFLALQAAWIALSLLSCFAAVMELICVRRAGTEERRARARAACRTGRFALALPTVLFLLLSIFSWSLIAVFATNKHLDLYESPRISSPIEGHSSLTGPASVVLSKVTLTREEGCAMLGPGNSCDNDSFLRALIVQSAPPGLPVVLGLVAAGFLLLVLVVICSVYYEVSPQVQGKDGRTRALGAWLSGGLRSFWIAIGCFWLAAFGWPVIYTIIAWVHFHYHHQGESFLSHLYTWNRMGQIANSILFGAAAAILASIAVLGMVFKGASKALDIILDVDNYLRTSPEVNTPRARIVERYVALLNFLHGAAYDQIIIVAHSLGSNISADLLRFLQCERIPQLTEYARAGGEALPRIRLMTMGSPLRQLLNRFFPLLYLWIRPMPDDTRELAAAISPFSMDPAKKNAIIPSDAYPSPQELGVESWTNVYRSGDYVGRSIWLDAWYQHARDETRESPDEFYDIEATRFELCMGIGAHTHYWDGTAPQIAEYLERLICQASGLSASTHL